MFLPIQGPSSGSTSSVETYIYYMEFKLIDVEISSCIFLFFTQYAEKTVGCEAAEVCRYRKNSWGQHLDCDVTLYWRLLSLVVSICCPQTGHTTLSYTPYRQLENQAPNTTGSNHLHNTLELMMMGIIVPETC